jgi:hypothetical protein
MDNNVKIPAKKPLTKRQLLRLEGTLRHADRLFSKLAQKERKIEQIQTATEARIDSFAQTERGKNTTSLEKLASTHKETFDQLCRVVEKIENESQKRFFVAQLGKYGIRGLFNAVSILEGYTEDQIIDHLEKDGLGDYVETKKTLKKAELKRDMPQIPGISYVGKTGEEEYFTIVKTVDGKKPAATTKPRPKKNQ